MARLAGLTGLLLICHSFALADTVYGTGSLVSSPMLGSGTAFWDNASRDGPASCVANSVCSGTNVGYFLTDSGNFPALCTYNGPPPTPDPACGSNYLGAQGQYYAQSSTIRTHPRTLGLFPVLFRFRSRFLASTAPKISLTAILIQATIPPHSDTTTPARQRSPAQWPAK
jgi:hypothetical protein